MNPKGLDVVYVVFNYNTMPYEVRMKIKFTCLAFPLSKTSERKMKGKKTVVTLHIRRRRNTMLNLAASEGHVPRKALTNGCAILQLSVLLTFHHLHIGPLFVTGFSK